MKFAIVRLVILVNLIFLGNLKRCFEHFIKVSYVSHKFLLGKG